VKRSFAAVVSALLCLALLAACGASSGSEPAAPEGSADGGNSAVLLAAARTTDAGSARMAMTIAMTIPDVPGLDGPVRLGAEGAFDFAGRRGTMKLDYSGLLAALGAQADQARGLMPDEMRIDGTTVYMRMPGIAALRSGKSWVRFDAAELAAQQGLDQSLFGSQLGRNDPSQFLEYLKGASDRVQEIGRDEVRGVPATHYHAVIDMTKAPAGLTDAQRAHYEQAIAELAERSGLTELPTDVWIDDEGLLRRIVMNVSLSAPGAGSASMLMTMDLFDFGVEIVVEAPPAGKVLDFTELVGLGAR
jgi:hypothetical protein